LGLISEEAQGVEHVGDDTLVSSELLPQQRSRDHGRRGRSFDSIELAACLSHDGGVAKRQAPTTF